LSIHASLLFSPDSKKTDVFSNEVTIYYYGKQNYKQIPNNIQQGGHYG